MPLRAALVALALGSIVACRSTSTNVSRPSTNGKCTATVTVSAREFSADGGTGRLTVDTERDCSWTVQADAAWLTFTPSEAIQGSGAADFLVAATVDPVPRSVSLTVIDQKITISQGAARCRFGLSASEFSVPATGGGHDIDVTASSALCEWTAQTDATWLSFRTPRAFKGSGRVTVEAAPWTGPPRRAEVIVADQKVALTQSSGCVFSLTPSSAHLPAAGGAASVSVQTMAGCGWSSSNGLPWLAITNGSAPGPGSAQLAVTANAGPARAGTLTIANRPFAVIQESGCQYSLHVNAATYPAEGGWGWIAVTTTPECPWSTARQVDWISTISSPASGGGAGSVSFLVAPNFGGPRVGTLTIGNQTFTIYQAGQ
jgi:hypothetical protein